MIILVLIIETITCDYGIIDPRLWASPQESGGDFTCSDLYSPRTTFSDCFLSVGSFWATGYLFAKTFATVATVGSFAVALQQTPKRTLLAVVKLDLGKSSSKVAFFSCCFLGRRLVPIGMIGQAHHAYEL